MAKDSTVTEKPFGRALRDLLLERADAAEEKPDYITGGGNISWRAYSEHLGGMHYETFRKALVGERPVTAKIIEAVAEDLGIDPAYFVEYRLFRAREAFDVQEQGFDKAYANLKAFGEAQAKLRRDGHRP